jgi:hypothetical protein
MTRALTVIGFAAFVLIGAVEIFFVLTGRCAG